MSTMSRAPLIGVALLIVSTLIGLGCSQMPLLRTEGPPRVEVQHILVGFQGTVPGKPVVRTRAEAESLATALLDRARAGEDFDKLVQTYTDDWFPGIYRMVNEGVTPTPGAGESPRSAMSRRFGDISFSLPVGGIGTSRYDARTSPYGWHIIKRLR